MQKMIRYELIRALTSIKFRIAILIGAGIAVSHFIMEVLPHVPELDVYLSHNKAMLYPGWLYPSWMCGNRLSVHSYLYFLILPLLAALPSADSFFDDVSGGYLSELCTRTKRSCYLVGKYIAVFLSGAVTVVFPLILNFLLTACAFPMLKPERATGFSTIVLKTSLSELYYTQPGFFLLIHFLMIFVMAGLFAVFALSASYYCNYQFMALISPFLLYISMIAVFGFLDLPNWQPNQFLDPAYSDSFHGDILTPFFTVSIVLFLISFVFYFKGRRADVF